MAAGATGIGTGTRGRYPGNNAGDTLAHGGLEVAVAAPAPFLEAPVAQWLAGADAAYIRGNAEPGGNGGCCPDRVGSAVRAMAGLALDFGDTQHLIEALEELAVT